MPRIIINIDKEQGRYEFDVPDNVKTLDYDHETGYFHYEAFEPEVVEINSQPPPPPEPELEPYEIVEGTEGEDFLAACYYSSNPVETAKELANIKRDSAGWKRFKKAANQHSCQLNFKDPDICINEHLTEYLQYFIGADDLVENLLTEVGRKYNISNRSRRLNFAAHEVQQKVISNGTGRYYTEEDLKRPLEFRQAITLHYSSLLLTLPYYLHKSAWLDKMNNFFLNKFVYPYIMSNDDTLMNTIPEDAEHKCLEHMDYVLKIERKISIIDKNLPKGLFHGLVREYYHHLANLVKEFLPGIDIDLSDLSYDEIMAELKDHPNEIEVRKIRVRYTNYVRSNTNLGTLRDNIKLHFNQREHNVYLKCLFPHDNPQQPVML